MSVPTLPLAAAAGVASVKMLHMTTPRASTPLEEKRVAR